MSEPTKLPAAEDTSAPDDVVPASVDAEAAPDLNEERVRGRTLSRKQMTRELRRQMREGAVDPEEQELRAELESSRPKLRSECATGPRPCLFVSCKYHLYLDVNPRTGSVKLNFRTRPVPTSLGPISSSLNASSKIPPMYR